MASLSPALGSLFYAPATLYAQPIAGALDLTFTPQVTGASVNSVAIQTDGKILIAGQFGQVSGEPRFSIARLLPDGTVEPATTFKTGTGANGAINCIAVLFDGGILIGGDFTSYNGQPANRIARLLPDGSLDTGAPFGSGANAAIRCLAVQPDGKVVVAGDFTLFNSFTCGRIARLTKEGFLDPITSFNPAQGAANGGIDAITLEPSGKILIGGSFNAFAGQSRNFLARLNPNGSLESTASFNPGTGPSGPVRCLAIHADGRILLGGDFAQVNGTPRGRIARLYPDGAVESTATFNVGSGIAGTAQSLAVQPDGRILVGGGFSSVNNQSRICLARLESDGTVEGTSTFDTGTGVGGLVSAITLQRDGKIVIGGQFSAVNAQPRSRIARLENTLPRTGPTHELLWSFHTFPKEPSTGALVLGPDGYYWGTSLRGGVGDNGTVYKVKPDGSEWKVIVSFTGQAGISAGSRPTGGLVSDGAGYLWGTTRHGGTFNSGTIFKVNAETAEFTSVLSFTGLEGVNRGSEPTGELIADGKGNLWGTAAFGGSANRGTVFRVDATTGVLATIVDFAESVGGPRAGLTSDSKGFFWGATIYGGVGVGTVFKVNQQTGSLTYVASIDPSGGDSTLTRLTDDGHGFMWGTTASIIYKVEIATGILTKVYQAPVTYNFSGLISDGAGSLWGASGSGGGHGFGGVFKIDVHTGEFTDIASFAGAYVLETGSYPVGALVMDTLGTFLGTTGSNGPTGGGTAFRVNAATGELSVIASFADEHSEKKGTFPYAGLVSDGAGALWGTTQHGGLGNGTVFKIDEITGQLTTVAQFTNIGETNRGAEPRAMLTPDGKGFLWGSTSEGGTANAGTIFKVNTSTGELSTALEFSRDGLENRGARPNGELIPDGRGFFWGTTFQGGVANGGTVFKLDQGTGKLTTIREFSFDSPGYGPYAALSADGSGSFWGTVNRGDQYDSGGIFKINVATGQFSSVLPFTALESPNLGTEPRARLFNDGKGAFWGITSEGGIRGGARGLGTVFRVDMTTNQLSTVARFTGIGGPIPGSEPRPQLTRDVQGNLVGTTWEGGANDYGTVFKINPDTGQLTTILDFTGPGVAPNSGSLPGYGALLMHTDGNLYGVTQEGGPESGGTIFRLRYGPAPLTLSATSVRAGRAILRGTINPNGNMTAVQFEIGTSPSLPGAVIVSAGTSSAATTPEGIQQEVTDLNPGTTYYYRLVGTNAANPIPQRGAVLSFTTNSNTLPVVTLLGANPLTLEASAAFVDPGATAEDVEDGELVPVKTSDMVVPAVPGTYTVDWSATDSDEFTGTATRTVKVVDTTKPVLNVSADVSAVAQQPAGVMVNYEAATATDLVGVAQLLYSHPSGSVFPLGTTTVTVIARDSAGNESVGTFTVRVTLAQTVHQLVALEGAPVPGAGVDPRLPTGAVWANFGSPAISGSGKIAFTGRWTAASPGSAGKGLFIGGVLAAAVGDSSPVAGTVIRQLSAPAFAQDSDAVLVAATVAAPGSIEETQALLRFDPAAELLARVGQATDLGDGVQISRFVGASLSSQGGLILARLSGGPPVIDQTNSLALFATSPTGLVTLARTGQTILGKSVAGLGLLKSISGSPAQGRGESSAAGVRFIVRFTDQTKAIVETAEAGDYLPRAVVGGFLSESAPFDSWWNFSNSVSSSLHGDRFAFLAETVPPLNELSPGYPGIFIGSGSGFQQVAASGSPAPEKLPGAFASFGDPVLSADGRSLAFVAKLGPGQSADTGIFTVRGDGPLAAVATLKSAPPGVPSGARWKSFVSLAAPGGGVGPIFQARLETGGPITEASDEGLWAVDASGELRGVVRESDTLGGKQVKTVQALKAVNGISGPTRAFNSAQQLVWKASFTDQSSAVVLTTLP